MKPSFDIAAVVEGRSRLTLSQAAELHAGASLHDLGEWAQAVSERLHPEPTRTFVIDRNINYTNVCTARCTFCAFRRDAGDTDAYTLSLDELSAKVKELIAIGGTQILMQGGMNPELGLDYYLGILRGLKARFPSLHIHAFSPPEFVEFARFFGRSVASLLREFKEAGLDSIPGGGAEILVPRVRRRIASTKCSGQEWLQVMRCAHEAGMNTSATMMIGHIEFLRDRLEHMEMLRDMQDFALALRLGGDPLRDTSRRVAARWPEAMAGAATSPVVAAGSYLAFIHWPFQRQSNPLGRLRLWDPKADGPFDDSTNPDIAGGRVLRPAGGHEYLRMLAIARLFFDNIPNLQSSWVTMGPEVGQVALKYGANDMGSIMMEENVVSAAGTTYHTTTSQIRHLISDAGYTPAQRDQYYRVLRTFGPESASAGG